MYKLYMHNSACTNYTVTIVCMYKLYSHNTMHVQIIQSQYYACTIVCMYSKQWLHLLIETNYSISCSCMILSILHFICTHDYKCRCKLHICRHAGAVQAAVMQVQAVCMQVPAACMHVCRHAGTSCLLKMVVTRLWWEMPDIPTILWFLTL